MSTFPRRIVFRLDLGGGVGWGHLARCSALAAELRSRGCVCVAWTDGDLAVSPEDLREPFAEVRPVSAGPGIVDWMVVDHYGIGDAELLAMRQIGKGARLLVIDDDAVRGLAGADVAVNSRPGLEAAPYACARALLGERFALLRPGLRQPVPVDSPFPDGAVPVLVLFGGTDPRGVAVEALHALADVDQQRMAPVLLRGRDLAGGEKIARALARFSSSVWLERLNAAELAGWAHLCRHAISAAGGTLFELAALRLPFVGVIVADNQRAFGRAVVNRWHLPVVDAPGQERDAIAAALGRMLALPVGAHIALGEIDGRGAARVADVVESLSR